MSLFEEFVQKGRETARQRAENRQLTQGIEQAEVQHARQVEQLRETVQREVEVVTQTLVDGGFEPEQLAIRYQDRELYKGRYREMGLILGREERRWAKKRERLEGPKRIRVWDMHSTWTEYSGNDNDYCEVDRSCFLGRNGDVYTAAVRRGLNPDTEEVITLSDLDLNQPQSEVRLVKIREGLGYLVANNDLVVDL